MWQGGTLPKSASTNLTHGKTNAVMQYISQGHQVSNRKVRLPFAPASKVGGMVGGETPTQPLFIFNQKRSAAERTQKIKHEGSSKECASDTARSRSEPRAGA